MRGIYIADGSEGGGGGGGGAIYGIPCHADSILKIIPSTDPAEEDVVTTVSWDRSDPRAPPRDLKWKWHGGATSPVDNCFYAIPQAADYVMKLDPSNDDAVTFLGPPLPGRNLWYGGLVGPSDGAVYGICQNATGILRIDPVRQDATVCGEFKEGGYKWHGGVIGPDGNIYGIPAHADAVLRIVPPTDGGAEPEIITFGGPLRTGSHRSDNKYKYLGGAAGIDGCVYFFPSDADYVLRVNPHDMTAKEVGPNLRECEALRHNKWQNGFSARGGRAIYGIPLKARSIVRILCHEDGQSDPDVKCVGGPYGGLNKWEGGVMSADGDMYCMPLNCDWVLRMRPVRGKGSGEGNEDANLVGSQGS
uniref:Uncharacterized protein n=1 Tax=Odontella aurita TaxID=265563 RepID=A0A7S4MQY6_9STRA